jgi:1-acyl-sn-glycerol-3-phosphate acyltransferase
MYEFLRIGAVLQAGLLHRTEVTGSFNVPNGPVILAPNHGSFADHFLVAAFLRRHVQFMAKSQLFSNSLTGAFYSSNGVFPVRRGHQDEETFVTARTILQRGGLVCMYVEGGRSRTGAVGTQARPGIGRIALESGAPIVPVAILGSNKIRNWKRLRFPKIYIEYGEPFAFEQIERPSRGQQQAVANETLRRIRALHDGLAARHARPDLARAATDPGRGQA